MPANNDNDTDTDSDDDNYTVVVTLMIMTVVSVYPSFTSFVTETVSCESSNLADANRDDISTL